MQSWLSAQLAVEVCGNQAHLDDALTLELPVVTQLLPNHGPHQGGQLISLIGMNFGSRSPLRLRPPIDPAAICLPHLHRDWAHPRHICTGIRLSRATSAPGLDVLRPTIDSAVPSARACGIRARYVGWPLTLPTSAPGLGSSLRHLRRYWAYPCHICAGTGLTPATSAPGLGSPFPHLRRDWAHPCHICPGTGLSLATSAPGLGSPLPHLRRDWAHCGHMVVGWDVPLSCWLL